MSNNPHTALVVVDVQNDFVEGGSLACAGGLAVASAISTDLMTLDKYSTFAFTKDFHIDPGEHWSQTPDYVNTWPVHCDAFGDGSNLVPAVSDKIDVLLTQLIDPDNLGDESRFDAVSIFRKGQFKAAYSGAEGFNNYDESLVEWLHQSIIGAVHVVGIAFDYCVKATAIDLARAGFDVTVFANYTVPVHTSNAEAVIAELVKENVNVVYA